MVIIAFACLHIASHLAGLQSVASHLAFMDAARSIYRHRVVESFLLLCVAFQIASGLWSVVCGWKQRHGVIAWLQAGSGAFN